MDTIARENVTRERPFGSRAAILKRLYRCMLQWRSLFYSLLVLMALSLACELLMPIVMELAINTIGFSGGLKVDMRSLAVYIGLFLFIVVLTAAAGAAQGRISARITLGLSRNLREKMFTSLMGAPVSDFERMRRGDLMSRMMTDAEMTAGAFTDSFTELVSCVVMAVGSAAIMFVKCRQLAVITVGTGILSVLVMGALSGLVFPVVRRRQAALGQLNSHVEESLKAFATCKAGGRMGENNRRMRALSDDYCAEAVKANRLEFILRPTMLVLGNLSFMLTVVFGTRQLISGAITVGVIQAFVMYSRQFMEPLSAIGEQFVKAQNALACAERVFRVIDGRDEREALSETARKQVENAMGDAYLAFDDVRFAYKRNLPVLQGVTFSLNKGEHLALVGRTGAGKTTLSALTLLFYFGYTGKIHLEGRELRDYDPTELRSRIAVVSQEPEIIDGTVFENMTYGSAGRTREDVWRVIRELGADGMIEKLPNGLDTCMEHAGDSLSQGELQLICLCRALLRDASVVILDEATSALDAKTEFEVVKAIKDRGITCIVIAHRLSTIRDCDEIIVLEKGKVVERGTHDELMKLGGTYTELVTNE